jgi:hypothetical protein
MYMYQILSLSIYIGMYNLILRNENTNSEVKELSRFFEFLLLLLLNLVVCN